MMRPRSLAAGVLVGVLLLGCTVRGTGAESTGKTRSGADTTTVGATPGDATRVSIGGWSVVLPGEVDCARTPQVVHSLLGAPEPSPGIYAADLTCRSGGPWPTGEVQLATVDGVQSFETVDDVQMEGTTFDRTTLWCLPADGMQAASCTQQLLEPATGLLVTVRAYVDGEGEEGARRWVEDVGGTLAPLPEDAAVVPSVIEEQTGRAIDLAAAARHEGLDVTWVDVPHATRFVAEDAVFDVSPSPGTVLRPGDTVTVVRSVRPVTIADSVSVSISAGPGPGEGPPGFGSTHLDRVALALDPTIELRVGDTVRANASGTHQPVGPSVVASLTGTSRGTVLRQQAPDGIDGDGQVEWAAVAAGTSTFTPSRRPTRRTSSGP